MARTFLSCAPKSSISLMQLKLLPDEALDSFISRNFVYAQRWRDTSIKKWYGFAGVGHWTVSKIRNLVDIFGWDKHGGYSYLFHYHTNYYRGVFALDTMGWGYPPERMSAFAVRLVAAHETVKLCPACLHSDLRDLGFIYWRRSHQGYDIEVCAQHNIKLVSACGGCHKPLLADRHFLEALGQSVSVGMPYPIMSRWLTLISQSGSFQNLLMIFSDINISFSGID